MRQVLVFLVCSLLGGFGGALGSVLGHAAGQAGLWIGGVIGGIVGSIAAVAIARAGRWIGEEQFAAAALGASVGFLLAAAIAVNTLSSPIGPVLSTSLIGAGALVGARRNPRRGAREER